MRLLNARIHGFQSFDDSGELNFRDGINLVVGQNNSGKSALLRALRLPLSDDPHRTPVMWEPHTLPQPFVYLTLEVRGGELRDWFLRSPGVNHFPLQDPQEGGVVAFMEETFSKKSLCIYVKNTTSSQFAASSYPSHHEFEYNGGRYYAASIVARNGDFEISTNAGILQDSLPLLASNAWNRDMFYFAAERMTIGEATPGYADRLQSNAANLPNVLNTLSNERGDTFDKLVHHLREIFPTVGNLSIPMKPNQNTLEVRIWPTEKRERVELSFPLNSSGTGVAQVIAFLAAIMTIPLAVIIIDEINSFLHPSAVKALLRILQTQYPQHQYIISTHAPDVISFSNPSTIHLVKRVEYESKVRILDVTKVEELREVGDHLGVSMADVFAADRIIWVEGATEELCFPYIYQQTVGLLPKSTIFTSVVSTGDFNARRRDPTVVYDVYRRLSTASSTLVIAVAFSFDSENLTEEQKQDMKRRSGSCVHFLPRRHLECYLIDPVAIAAFIASKDSSCGPTVREVEAVLKRTASEKPFYIAEWNGDIDSVDWLARVDAAKLLDDVCGTLSEHRVRFAKKDDSLFLLRSILERDSERLTPLREYVADLVAAVAAQ